MPVTYYFTVYALGIFEAVYIVGILYKDKPTAIIKLDIMYRKGVGVRAACNGLAGPQGLFDVIEQSQLMDVVSFARIGFEHGFIETERELVGLLYSFLILAVFSPSFLGRSS